MNKRQILVVDDESSHRLMLKANLSEAGYEVHEADDGAEAILMVEKQFYDLVLLDLKMKHVDGIEALKQIKQISPAIPVLIMTAYASVETAVEGLKLGAFDYMIKPLDMDTVLLNIEKTLNYQALVAENKVLKERLNMEFDFSQIIGQSKAIRDVFEVISMAAPSDATVLILGETGTGKELVANSIHQHSIRHEKPFIKVNCAALAENLLESELFGHERGAFTGAATRRRGRFEQAADGTLFLDEIGDMSLTTQAKILRVLQEGEFERLGAERTLKVNVRIIAATNKDLEKAVVDGTFRHDLYFRLSVVPVHLPALRQRGEDLLLLAEHFLEKYAQKNRRLIKGFTSAALDVLWRYHWPGNVRELENVIERAVIMTLDQQIKPEVLPIHLQENFSKPSPSDSLSEFAGHSIKEMEKRLIVETLKKTGNNITRAAEVLGLSRRGLQYKLKEIEKE